MQLRETAAEHLRNALSIGCADEAALTRRLRAALREVEAGNLKNPQGKYAVLARKRGGKRRFLVAFFTGSTTAGGGPIYQQVRDKLTEQEAYALIKELEASKNPPGRFSVWVGKTLRGTFSSLALARAHADSEAHPGAKAWRKLSGSVTVRDAAIRDATPAGGVVYRKNPRRTLSQRARALVPRRRVPARRSRRNPVGRSEREAWDRVEGYARRITRTARNAGVLQDAQNIMAVAMEMGAQVRAGVHENPTLAVLGNPGRKTLSTHTYGGAIRYRHRQDGKDYRHTLGSGAPIFLLPDGSIQLQHPTKRLWEDM